MNNHNRSRKRCLITFCALCVGLGIMLMDINTSAKGRNTKAKTDTNKIEQLWRQCDLPQAEWPDYYYFTNEQQRHYNLSWEDLTAFAVKDYAMDAGMKDEEWELKQLYYYRDDIYQAYTESDKGSELYILFKDSTSGMSPNYIITADIRKTADGETTFPKGKGSYNSMLEWYSYEKWFVGDCEMEARIPVEFREEIYDSIYGSSSYYAIYDYLDRFDGDKEIPWVIEENTSYVGRNGIIASMSCVAGTEQVNLLVDVWNRRYAIIH